MSSEEENEYVENDNDVFFDQEDLDDEKQTSPYTKEPEVKHEDYRTIIIETEQQTSDRITLFEYTELTGIRAEEIARFNNCYVSIDGLTEPIKMADREFMMRKNPLKVKRYLGHRWIDGAKHEYYEYIDPNLAIHPARAYDI